MVIDAESKQAWLVPMLSLVLHLCHRYYQEFKADNIVEGPVPFAKPSHNGSAEARRVLESSGDIPVLISNTAGSTDGETLRQLFLRINTNLLNATETRERPSGGKIFASELMDMVVQPGCGSPLKEIEVSGCIGSWEALLEAVDVVGVCANIGQAIQPAVQGSTVSSACECCLLPCDEYLLAAHTHCLEELSQRVGHSIRKPSNGVCKLGERAFWKAGNSIWTKCPASSHQSIWANVSINDAVLQRVSNKGKEKSSMRVSIAPEHNISNTGVVVFGGCQTKVLDIKRLMDFLEK